MFRLVAFSIFLSLIFAPTWAGLAAEPASSEVRLDVPGGSLAEVPVMDQGRFGDCYSNVAAQMIDAYRFTHGDRQTGFHASALVLAAQTKLSESALELDRHQVNGGGEGQAIRQARRSGICNSETLRLKNGETTETYMARYASWQQARSQYNSFHQLIREISGHYADLDKHDSVPALGLGWIKLAVAFEEAGIGHLMNEPNVQKQSERESQQILDELSSGGHRTSATLAQIKTLLNQNKPADLVELLEDESCRGENHLGVSLPEYFEDAPPVHVMDEVGAAMIINPIAGAVARSAVAANAPKIERAWVEHFEKEIGAHLDSPRAQPIDLGICANVLEKGASYSGDVALFGDCRDGSGHHAILLIGRRPNPRNGRLEYLLRNSWGPYCVKQYSKDWECEASHGALWLDAEVLLKSTFSIGWFR